MTTCHHRGPCGLVSPWMELGLSSSRQSLEDCTGQLEAKISHFYLINRLSDLQLLRNRNSIFDNTVSAGF